MSAPIKHLKPADYRVMPWKNGSGSTTEIAVEPASGDAFVWRVSMADLKQSGPFSLFPGIDRVITPIEGPAFRLLHGAFGSQEVTPLVPYAFSGDWPTAAELKGPGRDYNLMIRRAAGSCWTEVLHGGSRVLRRTYRNGTLVLTALADAAVSIGSKDYSLKAFETLVASAPGELRFAGPGLIILSAINT